MPTVIPGVVLGILATLCCVGFLCWALISACCACCSLACCPRCCRRRGAQERSTRAAPPGSSDTAQFIAAVDSKKVRCGCGGLSLTGQPCLRCMPPARAPHLQRWHTSLLQ